MEPLVLFALVFVVYCGYLSLRDFVSDLRREYCTSSLADREEVARLLCRAPEPRGGDAPPHFPIPAKGGSAHGEQ